MFTSPSPSDGPRVPVPLTLDSVRHVFMYLGRPPSLIGIADSLPGDVIVPVELNTAEMSTVAYILQQITAAKTAKDIADISPTASSSGTYESSVDSCSIVPSKTVMLPPSMYSATPHNETLCGAVAEKSETFSAISMRIKVPPILHHVLPRQVTRPSTDSPHSSTMGFRSPSPPGLATATASPGSQKSPMSPPSLVPLPHQKTLAKMRADAPTFTSVYALTPPTSKPTTEVSPGFYGFPHGFSVLPSMAMGPERVVEAHVTEVDFGLPRDEPTRRSPIPPRKRRRSRDRGAVGECAQKPSVPPAGYVCHKCHCVGHYLKDCGRRDANNFGIRLSPPAAYRCDLCGKGGHWIAYCHLNC